MTTVYLIRHTQAEGNLYRAMQGQWDGDITEIGVHQIDALRRRMENEQIDAVYSSDLYRAYVTAYYGIAAPRNLKIKKDARLRELNVGSIEREFFGNVYHSDPEMSEIFMFDSEKWVCQGAETFDDVRQRMYAAIEDIAKENDGKTVAVCSHGVSLRCFLSKVYGVNLKDVETVPICKNTAVTKLEYEDGKFSVVYKNQYDHLGKYDPPKWNSTADLRDEKIDFAKDAKYYIDCYSDGWSFAHGGSIEGFEPNIYLACAKEHSHYDSHAVRMLYEKDKRAGIVDLDTARGEDEGYGWISFLYLEPEYRGKGYGIQALGRAILLYDKLGRSSIRLTVNKQNTIAIAFYKKYDFEIIKDEGNLLLMERKLTKRLPLQY